MSVQWPAYSRLEARKAQADLQALTIGRLSLGLQ
jgi:hypothetical protein